MENLKTNNKEADEKPVAFEKPKVVRIRRIVAAGGHKA